MSHQSVGALSPSLLTSKTIRSSPRDSPSHRDKTRTFGPLTQHPVKHGVTFHVTPPVYRGTESSSHHISHLPRPILSSRTASTLSPRARLVNPTGRAASFSRTLVGDSSSPGQDSRTRHHNAKGVAPKDRSTSGPSSISHGKIAITPSTSQRILPGSSSPTSSSASRNGNTNSSYLSLRNPPAPRRSQLGNLIYSASSPNINHLPIVNETPSPNNNHLPIVNENVPPVPFAPRSELHERILNGRRGSVYNDTFLPNSLYRNSPYINSLYSNPTVASSALTASASSNDISQPRSKDHGQTEQGYSRIPSSTSGLTSRHSSRRYLSSPVRRAIEKGEESQARRRYRSRARTPPQIDTGRPSPPGSYQTNLRVPAMTPEPVPESASLSKSKSFGVFSSLKNSSSISWLNSNRSVPNPSHSAEPTTSTTSDSAVPEFTTNTLQVHEAQSSAYWLGRYQALFDKYQTEDFNFCVQNPFPHPESGDVKPDKESVYYKRGGKKDPAPRSPVRTDSTASLLEKPRKKTPARSSNPDPAFVHPSHYLEDSERRGKKVLMYLESQCCTSRAKKSLREWQIQLAIKMKSKALMPENDPDEKGFFGRVGRAITGGVIGSKNGMTGRGTGMGKRSAFGLRRGRSGADKY